MQQTHLIRENPKLARAMERGRVWRWRIEPDMEEAFQELLGWLLSDQRNAEMETVDPAGQDKYRGNGRLAPRHADGSAANDVSAASLRG